MGDLEHRKIRVESIKFDSVLNKFICMVVMIHINME